MNKLKVKIHKIYRSIMHSLPCGNKPDFMIIGAQKAGTTSLHSMLVKHPGLSGGLKKEVHFFDRDRNFKKGYNWYHKNFKSISLSKKLFFDATPDYIAFEIVLERIKNYDPDIKLILILREPSSRAYSAWNFYKSFSQYKELPTFHEVIMNEKAVMNGEREENWISILKILRRGFYYEQIKMLEGFFPKENILLLDSNELRSSPVTVLNSILRFIGQNSYEWNLIGNKKNAGIYKEKMNPEDKFILNNLYQEDLKKLKEEYQISY